MINCKVLVVVMGLSFEVGLLVIKSVGCVSKVCRIVKCCNFLFEIWLVLCDSKLGDKVRCFSKWGIWLCLIECWWYIFFNSVCKVMFFVKVLGGFW